MYNALTYVAALHKIFIEKLKYTLTNKNNKRGKMQKAQAALEFLMTYGWAIMVVLVAIGALANMDVLSIDKLSPKKCSLESGIACTDSIVNENSVSLALVNSLGKDITITSVEAGKCNAANIGKLENGKKIVVPLSGCENIPNKKFKEDVNIYYRGESGLDRVMKGTIIGTVETGKAPKAGPVKTK